LVNIGFVYLIFSLLNIHGSIFSFYFLYWFSVFLIETLQNST